MIKKKTKKETEMLTMFVTFNDADTLMNVKTGEKEPYHTERRNNLVCTTNYIVKIENKEDYIIEYDLFPLRYGRFEPEPEATLYDYLCYKYDMCKEYRIDLMVDNVLFRCSDTAETYTWEHIRKKRKEDLKAFCKETDECIKKDKVRSNKKGSSK